MEPALKISSRILTFDTNTQFMEKRQEEIMSKSTLAVYKDHYGPNSLLHTRIPDMQ